MAIAGEAQHAGLRPPQPGVGTDADSSVLRGEQAGGERVFTACSERAVL